jgi:hypothetical protein
MQLGKIHMAQGKVVASAGIERVLATSRNLVLLL